jgi:hypothetical protein
MKNHTSLLLVTASVAILFSSCKKDDTTQPPAVNPSELITTVQLLITDSATNSTIGAFSWKDIDGDGGNNPVIDTVVLQPTSTYKVSVLILDETKSPIDTVSNEVMEENLQHLLLHSFNQGSSLQFTSTDQDDNGGALGLEGILNTGGPTSGSYTLELRHYDSAADKVSGTPFETDIQVSFPVKVN